MVIVVGGLEVVSCIMLFLYEVLIYKLDFNL